MYYISLQRCKYCSIVQVNVNVDQEIFILCHFLFFLFFFVYFLPLFFFDIQMRMLIIKQGNDFFLNFNNNQFTITEKNNRILIFFIHSGFWNFGNWMRIFFSSIVFIYLIFFFDRFFKANAVLYLYLHLELIKQHGAIYLMHEIHTRLRSVESISVQFDLQFLVYFYFLFIFFLLILQGRRRILEEKNPQLSNIQRL